MVASTGGTTWGGSTAQPGVTRVPDVDAVHSRHATAFASRGGSRWKEPLTGGDFHTQAGHSVVPILYRSGWENSVPAVEPRLYEQEFYK